MWYLYLFLYPIENLRENANSAKAQFALNKVENSKLKNSR